MLIYNIIDCLTNLVIYYMTWVDYFYNFLLLIIYYLKFSKNLIYSLLSYYLLYLSGLILFICF